MDISPQYAMRHAGHRVPGTGCRTRGVGGLLRTWLDGSGCTVMGVCTGSDTAPRASLTYIRSMISPGVAGVKNVRLGLADHPPSALRGTCTQ